MRKDASEGIQNHGHGKLKEYMGYTGFVPSWNMRNSFVLPEGGSGEKAKIWVTTVLLLFSIEVRGNKEGEFSFLWYMECSRALDNVDKVLEYVSLWWSTNEDTDHTLAEMFCTSREDSLWGGEWSGPEQFGSIKGTIQVVGENFVVQPFRDGVTWPFRPFL